MTAEKLADEIRREAKAGSVEHSAVNSRPEANVCIWHIASFRCAAEFGRYRGIADSDKPSTAVTGRHGGGFIWAGAGWVALHGAAFLGGGPLGPRPWPRSATGSLSTSTG
jgi:hypothetical protein